MIRLNGLPINITVFPDNTSQVWKLKSLEDKENNYFHVEWDFSSESELLHLAQLKYLLDYKQVDCSLTIKYLPYARQDKSVNNFSTFALYPFSDFLNSLNFKKIYIIDPHSTVSLDLIKNSEAIYPVETIKKVIELTSPDVICYPDKGAKSKYSKIIDFPSIYAEKIRDQSTGNIISIKIIGNPIDQKVLIVDDICDGGGTFILLMDRMLKELSKETNLFVSHGIFSKGIKVLKDSGIKKIFTIDGEVSEDHNNQLTYRRL